MMSNNPYVNYPLFTLMKPGTLTIILLLLININLKAQTLIAGVVTDSLNNPVPFASVYLSKTSIGTYTDTNGVYSLIINQGDLMR